MAPEWTCGLRHPANYLKSDTFETVNGMVLSAGGLRGIPSLQKRISRRISSTASSESGRPAETCVVAIHGTSFVETECQSVSMSAPAGRIHRCRRIERQTIVRSAFSRSSRVPRGKVPGGILEFTSTAATSNWPGRTKEGEIKHAEWVFTRPYTLKRGMPSKPNCAQ